MRALWQWSSGLGAAIGLHLAAAALFVVFLAPTPVPQQPRPTGRLDLDVMAVRETRPDSLAPGGDAAPEVAGGGTALSQGPIRQSTGRAVEPDATDLDPSDAAAPRLADSLPRQDALAAIDDATTAATASVLDQAPLTALSQTAGQVLVAEAAEQADKLVAGTLPASDVTKGTIAPGIAGQAVPVPSQTISAVDQPAPRLASDPAPGTAIATSTAPTELASNLELPTASIQARVAPAASLRADAPAVAPTSAIATPSDPLVSQDAPAPVIKAQVATATAQPTLTPTAATTLAAAPSRPETLLAVVARPATTRPSTPRVQASLSTPLPSAPASAQPLPAAHMTAALAWTGGDSAALDPSALDLVQTLLLGSAPDSPGQEVRDGIANLLQGIPCARLHTVFMPETGTLELRGHVPEAALRAPLVAALQQGLGGSIPVGENLLVLPSPQCDALSGIDALGLPQSTDQMTNPALIGADAHVREYRFSGGQDLVLDLRVPEYQAYMYVDFYAADGQVIHLMPSTYLPLVRREADATFRIGASDPDDGGTGFRVVIGPPFGQEIAVAYAASVPLYEDLRPFSEPAGPYLEFLKTRIEELRAETPDFKGEWVYFFISTRPADG